MALQTDDLVMVGRGIQNDQPVNSLQPPLANGIHLRYAFARERGFPWFGYHLFRRLHANSKPVCVRPSQQGSLTAGSLSWNVPQGEFRSEAALVVGESFAPPGQPEFDLRSSGVLQFLLPPGQRAREFRVSLGFYAAKDVPPEQRTAVASPAANPARNLGCLAAPLVALARAIQSLFASPSSPAPPVRAKITAYQGAVPVAQTEISGVAGQIVTAELGADVMDRVEIVQGSYALIEICFIPALADASSGWQPLSDFPYPLSLPNAQTGYPCPGKPGSAAQAQAMAKGRVRYGDPNIWDDGRFTEMTQFLDDLLTGGPAGGPMAHRTAPDYVTGAGPGDPYLPDLYPLDMLLLGALHPSVAQALGLYWVDQTAADNTAYDYVVLADHDNSFHGSGAEALAALSSGNLPIEVDGWIAFNLKKGPAPVLTPPADPLCYALPGGVVASSEAGAIAPAGTNTAGLRWTLPMTPAEELLPGGAIFYHLWRADLGAQPPAGAPVSSSYLHLTDNAPILVVDAGVPAGATPQTAGDWPPFRLLAYDRYLADGWYSYRLAGVDIFGQYSGLSAPARWRQWAPIPNPRPWYYVGAASDTELHAYALHLRDTTPPPAPPDVEAYALDPLDPMLVQDGVFAAWFSGGWWDNLPQAQRAGHIGVRVAWRWTSSQMLQAPDTREFRIYFHPGGDPPAPDSRDASQWNSRIFVVNYGAHMTLDSSGDHVYEVLLPLINDADFGGVPLAPDNAHPVVYGHIGVSAADDKTATDDHAVWQGTPLGNRFGNEGRLGVPAKIYRVLRTPPSPPAVADTRDKVWATPADYHGHSYYTFRWPKPATDAALIDAHVFRAMDETLFEHDFRLRPRPSLNVNQPDLFPVAAWDAAARAAIKAELDGLNSLAPIIPSDTAATIAAKIQAALPAYRALSDYGLRTLASLPANEGAFSQITYRPLLHAEPENADRIGPDGDNSYTPNPTWCAYLAELDGRARNRYFFRAAFVNRAHDAGPLGPSSPPVYLPKVTPPRTPVITRVVGGEMQILISFAANREDDLAEYRIYRADNVRDARDIRLMELVQVVPAGSGASWPDATVAAGTEYLYRLTAVDSAGNESAPSKAATGRAIDTVPPTAPQWVSAEWVLYDAGTDAVQPWPQSGVIPSPYVAAVRLELTSTAEFCTVYGRVEGERAWQVLATDVEPISNIVVLFAESVALSDRMSYRAVAGNHLGARSPFSLSIIVEAK